ncbi:hypothetical protein JW859_02525 [bacterium]|nr:hypothetical protein [bacterium]
MWQRCVLYVTVAALAVMTILALAAYSPTSVNLGQRAYAKAAPVEPELPDNRLLHDQVSLCNLIDALWLEHEQLEKTTAILREYTPEIENLYNEMETAHTSAEFGSAMAELRDTLMAGQQPDEELKRRVNSLSGTGYDLRLRYQETQRLAAEELMPILTENQLVILGEYKPCLFNQNDPLNPERVGQASASGLMIDKLKEARNRPARMSDAEFHDRVERGLRRLAELSARATPFDVDVEEEVARLRGIFERALAMSDEEFALEAESLAAEMSIYLETRDQMIADHYNLPSGPRDRRLEKLAGMVVIPGALEVFQTELLDAD